jgi:hypothetical protein
MSTSFDQRDGTAGLPEGFAELPLLVYADDPRWVPEDRASLPFLFSPANPWFARGQARLFSAPGQARLVGFHHPDATIDKQKVAYFGYWETRATPEIDRALFEEVAEWARGQGAAELWGPVNFSTAGSYRLILSHEDGFLPFLGEPYNPPDYPGRLTRLGFEMGMHYATWVCGPDAFAQILGDHLPVRDRLRAQGYRFERISAASWEKHADELFALTNDSFAFNLGFVPFGKLEFNLFSGVPLIRRTDPDAARLVFGPEGDIVAFYLAFPDYGPLITQSAGEARVAGSKLDYARDIDALAARRPLRHISKTVAVKKNHRRHGIWDGVFADSLEPIAGKYPGGLIGALVRDDNFTGRVFAPTLRHKREYGLFRRAL